MKHLKAFTILEVTVAMLITSLCFAIAYQGYTIITETFFLAAQKNNKISSLVLTDELLRKDFMEPGSLIIRSETGIQFNFQNRKIDYEFAPNYVLRRQNEAIADTFRISVSSIQHSFEAKEIAIGERADELTIQTTLDGRNIQLNYLKKYSSEDLINK